MKMARNQLYNCYEQLLACAGQRCKLDLFIVTLGIVCVYIYIAIKCVCIYIMKMCFCIHNANMYIMCNIYIIYIGPNTVGPLYTVVLYNTKSDITRSDLGLRFVDSTTDHFYQKWHEICHWPIKKTIKNQSADTTYPQVDLLVTNLIAYHLGSTSQTNSPITTLIYGVNPPTK